ncbi:MAG: tyrosine--tRNA ligase, partial [Desulfobacterales bacterium]|nr:tyrosine--tRNA ligase [Desulfobacterales bacterium]
EAIHHLLKHPITCYIGFDPTASSFHVGSLIPIMALAHMQRHGHRPIALVGGGTALVGDPSGKTEMRQMLTPDQVNQNAEALKKQLDRFLDFEKGLAVLLNNAQWLTPLQYIPFLRDIGRHFSVNRMIKAESCKMRLESEEGLSFIEFNYMLLQAYDFLELFDSYRCRLQMGGSDQWGNILAGIELVRRMRHETVFGTTFPLITTSGGAKMGKTAKGSVWLDPDRTTPYEYYQYWINTDDRDVARFMALFTFLPMDEIREIEKLEGADLNNAKAVLAFEATKLVHGKEEAAAAYQASARMFGVRVVPKGILASSSIHRVELEGKSAPKTVSVGLDAVITDPVDMSIPHSYMDLDQLKAGIPAFKLFHTVGLADSSGVARRLIQQGGAYINRRRIETFDRMITDKDLNKGEILLRAGKKRYHRISVNTEPSS